MADEEKQALHGPETLPQPGSDQLHALIPGQVGRRLYRELFNHPEGLDINELKSLVPEYADQMHLDRRLRDLGGQFHLARERTGGRMRYRITGLREQPLGTRGISKKLRASLLYRDGSRCQMCGASPQTSSDVRLEIDHKIPLEWGGANNEDNLWVLCKTCNEGKQSFFASSSDYADQLRAAVTQPEVHKRLGELLRAFGRGNEVPSHLLGIVASAGRYQEDWQRRLRELRELGWDYEVRKRKEAGRIATYYVLKADGGWPSTGTIREELGRRRRAMSSG